MAFRSRCRYRENVNETLDVSASEQEDASSFWAQTESALFLLNCFAPPAAKDSCGMPGSKERGPAWLIFTDKWGQVV